MKRPSFQFYPRDWRNDPALQMVSLAAKGLWIEMICIMHEADPYGHLKIGEKIIFPQHLSHIVRSDLTTVNELLGELESFAIFSRNDEGCIYSKRMIRDEKIRNDRAAFGVLGGNPKLLRNPSQKDKVKPKVNLKDNHKDISSSEIRPTPSSSSSTSSSSSFSSSKNTKLNKDVIKINNVEKQVFDHWTKNHNRPNSKLDEKRKRKIKSALKLGYSQEQICQAIDGCAKSEWHMGGNEDGKIHNDISLILRDAKHIEQFIGYNSTGGNNANAGARNAVNPKPEKWTLQRSWAEREARMLADPDYDETAIDSYAITIPNDPDESDRPAV